MTITYKQLQKTWVKSQRVDFNLDMFGENEPVMIPENSFFVTLDDLIDLNITKENYHEIINLANYMMVDNVDHIIDEIVELTGNVDVVYEFEEFYRLSERCNKHLKKTDFEKNQKKNKIKKLYQH